VLDFRILGPFEVLDGDRPVALGGPKQRALLVVLLLRRGEVLSRDRLIDELWGERPPASAAKTVQVYVSNLRKALGDGVLLTRGQGYLLQLAPGQIDADRVAASVSEGRAALEGGDPQQASDRLHDALARWPSPPLADFAYEPFAQGEIARLEEERVAAREDRIDADLALGRHAALIGELEMLAGERPLRERLQALLMLALYRSGRQTEALACYQQARRGLIDELGIEPGPELQDLQRAILTQDPELGGPRRRAPAAVSSRRVGRLLALAGVLLLMAAVAATLKLLGGTDGSAALASASSDSVALISPASMHLQASFAVGGDPSSLAVSGGAVWALNADDQTVTRIDPSSHLARTYGTGGIPVDLAAGDGSVWVVNAASTRAPTAFPGAPTPFPEPTSVARLDPASALTLASIPLPRTVASAPPGSYQIAVGPQGVWVIDADGSVSRIDPASNWVVQRVPHVDVSAIATGAEATWAIEQNQATGSIAQLTADRGAVRHVRIPAVQLANSLSSIAVGAGAVWVTDPQSGLLWRIDPGPVPVERTITLAPGASDVAYGAGAIWVANGITGTVSRVDPHTNQVTRTIAVGNTPGRVIAGDGGVWVAVAGTNGVSVPAASQSHAAIDALPASLCGPVLSAGVGRPQRLIVSDLPLHGGPGVPALQMNAAITLVLREHNFRAGRVRLGYQTCDDSTAQTGVPDAHKCVSNAHAWVQHPLVVGVIGPYTSGCALGEIPIANQHGPLAIVSPTNSFVGLTHPDPLAPPGELTQLYPTGVRSYARVYPTDDREAAALAQFIHQHSHASVYVLHDANDPYSQDSVTYFQNAARRIGLHLAGSGTWNQPPRTYPALADRIANSGASAIYLGLDGVDRNAGTLIRALRQRLTRRVEILTNETAIPVGPLFQYAGSAARGVIIATAQVPNGPLDPAGRQFVARFAATQHDGPINNLAALYAAQATEVMLDAVGHSNGTRQSITRALLTSCVHNGILGSFCFDANGDPTVTPVTILQANQPGERGAELDTRGTNVVEVIDSRQSLTR
jgi:DNA-binding SARP family transcriptional activator/ABC-type branched-subunit amino acid transport system substrate-binding protein